MAKKVSEEIEEVQSENISIMDMDSFQKAMKKKYGSNILSLGTEILNEQKLIIPISPALDTITGGGVEEGSWIGLAGPSGCGKTTIALTIAANAQKPEYGSRPVFYINAEGRLKRKNLEGIAGLDASKVHVISSTKEKHLSGEEFSTIATNIIKQYERCIIIVDSVSSLCPSAEITEDVSGSIRSTNPRIMASFCRQNAGVVPVMNTIVVTIHHLINNTSGWGEKMMLDGGVKIGYQADYKLVTKNKPEKWMSKEGSQIGQIVEWESTKTGVGAPNGVVKSYIRFGKGLDSVVEVVNIAIELAIIVKSGAWFALPFISEDCKFQGQEKVNDFFAENPEMIDKVKLMIMENM
jgi:recombination protein RecA